MNKPFSSWHVDGTLKEKWIAAFKDPAFLILIENLIIVFIAMALC